MLSFLAAMSSSRSDDVTQFVILSVPFFLLVSSKLVVHLECQQGVLRVFQGSLKGVSRKFEGCFTEV